VRAEVVFPVDKSVYRANPQGHGSGAAQDGESFLDAAQSARLITFPFAFFQPSIGFGPTMLTPAARADGVSNNLKSLSSHSIPVETALPVSGHRIMIMLMTCSLRC
jgi:hypothetical protein